MYFRSILSGTLAALFLSVGILTAGNVAAAPLFDEHGVPVQRPTGGLPGVFSGEGGAPAPQVAQAADPRVNALEEQIRTLNGKIEEMNFQILQLQDQMRKMQEDNEFRFQELEKKKKSDVSGATGEAVANAAPSNGAAETPDAGTPPHESSTETPPAPRSNVESIIASDPSSSQSNPQPSGTPQTGTPERPLGTITVDKDGNVKSADAAPRPQTPPPSDTNVAAASASGDSEDLYRNSYQFILSGDYVSAETGFRQHIERFPKNERAADAHFWLGEAQLGQKKYRDAAETFLAAGKQYPKSKKAPEMLLKLGISLAGLNQKEVACATFAEVGKRYPNASATLKTRIKQEQALAAC